MTGGTLVCVMVDTNAMESLYHGVGSSSDEGRGESSASTEGGQSKGDRYDELAMMAGGWMEKLA